ncbi:MAG TPA: hypothetical protein VM802_27805 [Chitinophaga sp.]|uniref:hypothetical protein n=1 Tax=Chitinophaga sp. TaxID=1869181 RepID=UPI002D1A0DB2|nr:hypothetical protein [Chitinophaga sp.]HVI48705.1 hypothetical protein [Chitinophaga sp.]
MGKKFKFDAVQRAEVSKALETLKNDTLSAMSAELISGGLNVNPDWIKTTDWVKGTPTTDPVQQ